MDYIFCARNVQAGGFGSDPGPTRFLEIPDGSADYGPVQAIPRRLWFDRVAARAETGRDGATGQPEGDVLIYIHGYNTERSEVLRRLRAIRKGLVAAGFKGEVVGFDWPCANEAISYLEDRKDAKLTALRLVDDGIGPLTRYMQQGCRISVHVLAHSMGAYVLREAFDDADDRREVAANNWSISQILLCGADVSADSLDDGASSASLYRHCIRLTNYSNPFDAVLSISNVKRLGVAPRVGRVGLPPNAPAKAVNVDCGPYYDAHRESFAGLTNSDHCWYFFDPVLLKDAFLTIEGKIDRNAIPTRLLQAGRLYLRP